MVKEAADRFDGLRAFVTGGGSGIGQDTAVTLARLGAYVTVAGRTQRNLDETLEAIRAAGGQGQAVICDVSDEESIVRATAAAGGEHGQLDIAVNSAGAAATRCGRWPSTTRPSSTAS